jgi:aryl-alcohol dehydrogenase-like predicted oxidoreductase
MSPTPGILSQTTPNGLKEISWNSRLVLGTAAFQPGYGIINSGESPERKQWWNLLEAGLAQGIKKIDTAAAYGEAERILGDFGMKNLSVITKIRCEESRAGGDLEDKLVQSLRRLQIPRCYGLLLHNDEALAGASGGEMAGALHGLIRKGLVEKIGISSYEAARAEVLAQRYGLQILQIPCNPLDRRVVESGTLRRWTERGIEVHLRSVFLQGLLLRELPVSAHVSSAIPLAQARRFREECQAAGVSPLHACLSFVYGTSPTAHIVIGPTSVAELRQIADYRPDGSPLQPDGLPAWDPSFDPRSWESPVVR